MRGSGCVLVNADRWPLTRLNSAEIVELLALSNGLCRLTEAGATSSFGAGARSFTLKNVLPLWASRATKVESRSWSSASALCGPTRFAPWATKTAPQQADARPRDVALKLLPLVATNSGPPRVSVLGVLAEGD